MSSTVIIGFDKSGIILEDWLGRIDNSWRGAPVIWQYLEEMYLTPYFPDWVSDEEREKGLEAFELKHGYRPSRMLNFRDEHALDELWDLAYDRNVPEDERIALISTFDKVLIHKKEIPRVAQAFRNFPVKTSLPEQADILEEIYNAPDVYAIGWIQTTVCCDVWSGGYDEENDENIPYDLNVNEGHDWVFELLERTSRE